MKFIKQVFCSLLAISATMLYAQEEPAKERETGHVNQNKFRQMYNEFATPNMFQIGRASCRERVLLWV